MGAMFNPFIYQTGQLEVDAKYVGLKASVRQNGNGGRILKWVA